MRFRLIYTGDLCAHNQLRPKAQHKHDIRTKISPQLNVSGKLITLYADMEASWGRRRRVDAASRVQKEAY